MANLATANATEEERLKPGYDESEWRRVCSLQVQYIHYDHFITWMSKYYRYPTKPVFAKQPAGWIRLQPPSFRYAWPELGHRMSMIYCPTQGIYHVCLCTSSEAILKRQAKSASAGCVTKETRPIANKLKCSICSQLMKEAVIIQCCGESFCDE